MGAIFGLDVGTKTIGVARSDTRAMLAQPVTTLSRVGVEKDVQTLLQLARENDVERVIVGLPLELDGTEARSARLARQIGGGLETAGIAVTYIDERFSSVEAERHLIASGVSRKRRKQVIDQVAAVLILQSYLDYGDWSQEGT